MVIIDYEGVYYGPERVWKKGCNTPGLAMSRSIGDTEAHKIGVISEPDLKEIELSECGT